MSQLDKLFGPYGPKPRQVAFTDESGKVFVVSYATVKQAIQKVTTDLLDECCETDAPITNFKKRIKDL